MATLQEVETATLEMDAFEPALHVLGPCRGEGPTGKRRCAPSPRQASFHPDAWDPARITISFDTAVNAEGALEISLTMRVQLRVRVSFPLCQQAMHASLPHMLYWWLCRLCWRWRPEPWS